MIILFSGQQLSGKDESSDFMVSLISNFGRDAFANAVKDIFCKAFNVDRAFIEKWKRINECPPGFKMTVRKGLQVIGNGFRDIKENCWIEMISGNKVLSDGRFINESKSVKDNGGYNVLLWRPGSENDDPNKSESEIKTMVDYCIQTCQCGKIQLSSDYPDGMQYYDYFLINDGSLEHLFNKIKNKLLPVITEWIDGKKH